MKKPNVALVGLTFGGARIADSFEAIRADSSVDAVPLVTPIVPAF